MCSRNDNINPLLWLYGLKPGDRVIVNYGGQNYYKVAQVEKIKIKEVKAKKEDHGHKEEVLVYIKNCMNNIDVFKNGKRKIGGKWDLDEVLYEYTDDRYLELIVAPSVVENLRRFNFGKLLKSKEGIDLLVEISSKLKRVVIK